MSSARVVNFGASREDRELRDRIERLEASYEHDEKWLANRGAQMEGQPLPFPDLPDRFTPALEIEHASEEKEAPRPYRLYSAAELDDLPPPSWIIDGAIPEQSIIAIIGAKGVMKTFATLDLACHVATGFEWHGRRVNPCAVVYIYAEGPFGAKSRVDAWCALQNRSAGRTVARRELSIWFLPTRIPINDEGAVGRLLTEIRRLPCDPKLVIIDTLNQNLDGDEDGKGMGGFTDGCVLLRDALQATIAAVHHTPLGAEDRGRGHTSFDGAVDTRLIVSRDAERVTVECTHQRNGRDGWSVAYEAVEIGDSVALKPSSMTDGKLAGQRRKILEALSESATRSRKEIQEELQIKPSSFTKAAKWLTDKGYAESKGGKYGRLASGSAALMLPMPPECHHA